MTKSFEFIIQGLEGFELTEGLEQRIVTAARITVNQALTKARLAASEQVQDQVNFPANYFKGANSRIKIVSKASNNNLEGIIRGKARPTSLASFALSPAATKGVSVRVKPGKTRLLPGAFFIKLKAGQSSIDARFNLGLAVRTSGGKPRAAYKPTKIGKNLYLLYGPSVDQVLGGKNGVAVQITPEIQNYMQVEFIRLLNL